ncbi:MAG: multiheme c-type cytochrome [Syntrophobacteraceae bacterium]
MRKKLIGRGARMKTAGYAAGFAVILVIVSAAAVLSKAGPDYVVISWSNLGMQDTNKDFSTFALHPPFGALMAQVVKRGTESRGPSLVTKDVSLTYEVPNNTYSMGKTNLWEYAGMLFGLQLDPDTGITLKGLSGSFSLAPSGDHFAAEWVPITPYTDYDLNHEDPFQLAGVTLSDRRGNVLAASRPVIPVSNEISCRACHKTDRNIVANHPKSANLDPSRPVFCAGCHASNALGTKGIPRAGSLSERMHRKHDRATNNCYLCHAGVKTRFHRDPMADRAGLICQDCHGNMANIADSITQGRRPWIDEPKCGACHGPQYAEEPGKRFSTSKGHGGLYCSACHGSPHAILPSREERDNEHNTALQGFSGTLQNCGVCHERVPSGAGPHQDAGHMDTAVLP